MICLVSYSAMTEWLDEGRVVGFPLEIFKIHVDTFLCDMLQEPALAGLD